jgi:uncharacterized membrane protein YdbT with pleckstrin-like domain
MSYIDDNLTAGERVLYRAKLHWIVFRRPVIWLLIALVFWKNGSQEVSVVEWVALPLAIVSAITAYIHYTTSEFGLTNKRVLVKIGFIRRNSLETLLTRVEGILVNQGIFGRLLGYGSMTISGTGGSKEPFHKIAHPLEFRKRVQEQISTR